MDCTCVKSLLHIPGMVVESHTFADTCGKNHAQLRKIYVIVVHKLCEIHKTRLIINRPTILKSSKPIWRTDPWTDIFAHGRMTNPGNTYEIRVSCMYHKRHIWMYVMAVWHGPQFFHFEICIILDKKDVLTFVERRGSYFYFKSEVQKC